MVPAMGIQNQIQESYTSLRTLKPGSHVNRSDQGDSEMILALKFTFRLRRIKLRPRSNSFTRKRRFQLSFFQTLFMDTSASPSTSWKNRPKINKCYEV